MRLGPPQMLWVLPLRHDEALSGMLFAPSLPLGSCTYRERGSWGTSSFAFCELPCPDLKHVAPHAKFSNQGWPIGYLGDPSDMRGRWASLVCGILKDVHGTL